MRVVSLVPSLTEAVALSAPGCLVGATDYCTHPAELDVPRVGGSKYPDLAKVLALKPDVVLMNEEENRRDDAAVLQEAGVHVYVTYPRTVPQAYDELGALFGFLGVPAPSWLGQPWPLVEVRVNAVIPVWRRPWVVLGRDTFAGDVLRRLGVGNVFSSSSERYPRPSLAQMQAEAEAVVLPDEPYLFTVDDGPEAFPGIPYALISGRHLTWYGPSLAEAPMILSGQLRVICPA